MTEELAKAVYDALVAGSEGSAYIDEFYPENAGDVMIDGSFDFRKVGAALRLPAPPADSREPSAPVSALPGIDSERMQDLVLFIKLEVARASGKPELWEDAAYNILGLLSAQPSTDLRRGA